MKPSGLDTDFDPKDFKPEVRPHVPHAIEAWNRKTDAAPFPDDMEEDERTVFFLMFLGGYFVAKEVG